MSGSILFRIRGSSRSPPARLAGPTLSAQGYQPTMESGDILGHENMGEIIELGSEVTNLSVGDRVVVPFTISCCASWFCKKGMLSACDRTNPNVEMATKVMGQSPAGCSDSVPCWTAIAADTPSGMACPTRSRRPSSSHFASNRDRVPCRPRQLRGKPRTRRPTLRPRPIAPYTLWPFGLHPQLPWPSVRLLPWPPSPGR